MAVRDRSLSAIYGSDLRNLQNRAVPREISSIGQLEAGAFLQYRAVTREIKNKEDYLDYLRYSAVRGRPAI